MPQNKETAARTEYLMTTLAAVRDQAQDFAVVVSQLERFFVALWGLPLALDDQEHLSAFLSTKLRDFKNGDSDMKAALSDLSKLADAAVRNDNDFFHIIRSANM